MLVQGSKVKRVLLYYLRYDKTLVNPMHYQLPSLQKDPDIPKDSLTIRF